MLAIAILASLALVDDLRVRVAFETPGTANFKRVVKNIVTKEGFMFVGWDKNVGPMPIETCVAFRDTDRDFLFVGLAFWRDGKVTRVQEINRSDGDRYECFQGENFRSGNRLVRCGVGLSPGSGAWPALEILKLVHGRWKVQARRNLLDREGREGTTFLRRNRKIDPTRIVALEEDSPEHLEQPHVGPWLLHREQFSVSKTAFHSLGRKLVPTALSELEHLAMLSQTNQRNAFNRETPRASRATLWKLLRGKVNASCPNSEEYPRCNVLTLDQSITVTFTKTRKGWRVSKVNPTH